VQIVRKLRLSPSGEQALSGVTIQKATTAVRRGWFFGFWRRTTAVAR